MREVCHDAFALMRAEVCDQAAHYYAHQEPIVRAKGWEHPIDWQRQQEAKRWFESRHEDRLQLQAESHEESVAAIARQPAALVGGFLRFEMLCSPLSTLGFCQGRWFLESYDFAGSPRSSHKERLALELFLLRRVCGIDVAQITLYLPDRHFVYQEPIEWDRFFRPHNLSRSVHHRLVRIQRAFERLKNPPKPPTTPPIGPICRSPIRCDFYDRCLGHLPQHSVLSLARVDGDKRFDLIRRGYLTPKEVPESEPLGRYPHIQIRSEREGRAVVQAEAIAEYLLNFHYPLYFLDFETVQHVIPPFEGLRPFEPLPFSFSLHRLDAPDAKLEHFSYIVPSGTDGRKKMAAQLVALIGPTGRLVAYGAEYERQVLRKLAKWSPALQKPLESMAKRTLDLMIPFEKRWCYHPAMRGSHSLKRVAPALDAQLDYTALCVSDGRDAMAAYLQLSEADKPQSEAILAALEHYGALDSLAMVHIYRRLEALATEALISQEEPSHDHHP